MNDEASKLPEEPDKEHLPFLSGHVHPISESTDLSPNLFSRFVQKVGLIFSPQATEVKLSGRIKGLQTVADNVLFELLEFKKSVKEKVPSELFTLILTIIDPLIKEIGKTPPAVEKKDNTAQQVKLFSRYVDCIEKAKDWVELGKVAITKDQLEQTSIQQIAKEFISRIDRDIQVLHDYLAHALDSLELSSEMKNELKDKLMPGITPRIQNLTELKALPADLSLNSFIKWRAHADHSREILFGEVLHTIDYFSDEFLPSPKKENESAQLKLINDQMKDLEEQINKLTLDISANPHIDDHHLKLYLDTIEKLETIAHQLNGNLHLPAEDAERLDVFFEELLSLREDLS